MLFPASSLASTEIQISRTSDIRMQGDDFSIFHRSEIMYQWEWHLLLKVDSTPNFTPSM